MHLAILCIIVNDWFVIECVIESFVIMSKMLSNPLFKIIMLGASIGVGIGLTLVMLSYFLPKSSTSNNMNNNPEPNSGQTANTSNSFDEVVKQNVNFFCDNSDRNKSLVKIKIPDLTIDKTLFVLQTSEFDKSGWNKQKRCDHIAKKFQTYKNQGTLRNVKAGEVSLDGTIYPVICIADTKQASCTQEKVLVTLSPNRNANDVLTALTNTPDSVNVGINTFSYHNGDLILNLPAFIGNN